MTITYRREPTVVGEFKEDLISKRGSSNVNVMLVSIKNGTML